MCFHFVRPGIKAGPITAPKSMTAEYEKGINISPPGSPKTFRMSPPRSPNTGGGQVRRRKLLGNSKLSKDSLNKTQQNQKLQVHEYLYSNMFLCHYRCSIKTLILVNFKKSQYRFSYVTIFHFFFKNDFTFATGSAFKSSRVGLQRRSKLFDLTFFSKQHTLR